MAWVFGNCCTHEVRGEVDQRIHALGQGGAMEEAVVEMSTTVNEEEKKIFASESIVVEEERQVVKLVDDEPGPGMIKKRDGPGPRISRKESEGAHDEDARTFYAEAVNVNECPTWMNTGMSLEQLAAMATKLNIADLEFEVLKRIFDRIPKEVDGRLSLKEFLEALKGGPASITLRNMVTRYREGLNFGFDLLDDYDFSLPTNENYRLDSKDFFGDYKEIRQDRDYSYHFNYVRRRQMWQDRAIKSIVQKTGFQADPWLVYTCGPMGVGKGYAMSWMSKHGFFPLENIVHVDPDGFKLMMPEWPGYVEVNPEGAGTSCHMESCFMMEIAQEAAMQKRQNVWIDGSLRNAEFYAQQFTQVRARFPFYRIAIFYVTAPEATIRERIKHRAEATGRDVPEHLIQASLASMDKSLNTLTPLCDFVVRISNEGAIPVLKACETIDTSGAWQVIMDRLTRKAGGPGSFPNALQPWTLCKLEAEHEKLLQADIRNHCLFVDLSLANCEFHKKLQRILPMIREQAVGRVCSDRERLTVLGVESVAIPFPEPSRPAMGIPKDAQQMMWVYPFEPLAKSGVKRKLTECGFTEQDMNCSLMQLLNRGGFCFCNSAGKLISANTVTNQEGEMLLQFDKRQTIPEEVVFPDGLFQATPGRYREAEQYAFIPPGKAYSGHSLGGQHGALVFRLKVPGHPPMVSFPIMAD
mmetsp:Transcript_56530/g.132578  ORF Transcript_56530/g.132578 Transcript_56530/m.132578 type:complete len:695 (+) Transcript_56530:94-2178(+)